MGHRAVVFKVTIGLIAALLLVGGAAYFLFFRGKEGGGKDDNGNGEVKNRAPLANAGPSQIVSPGEHVILNGSGSSDPDGDDLAHHWDLDSGTDSNNDGIFDNDRDLTGRMVEHQYPAPQVTTTYLVTLNVTDGKLWDKATTRVTIMVSVNETPPEVVLSCRYGKVPGESPLEPRFILTVVSVTEVEMISNFSFVLESASSEVVSSGNLSDLLIAPPGSDIRYVDIIPVTRLSQNDLFYLKEGEGIKEGCVFRLFYFMESDPVGEVELTRTSGQ